MKTVWILEVLKTEEDWKQAITDIQEILIQKMSDDCRASFETAVSKLEEKITNYPDGKFEGVIGRSIYNQFTVDARESMRYYKGKQLRVVKAEIEDDDKYWVKYKNAIENPGVLRYLYATL